MNNTNKVYISHYFYCTTHDDGYILKTNNNNEPVNIINNHCGENPSSHCNCIYHGTKPRSQNYYDMCSGGWKIEYFNDNVYYEKNLY